MGHFTGFATIGDPITGYKFKCMICWGKPCDSSYIPKHLKLTSHLEKSKEREAFNKLLSANFNPATSNWGLRGNLNAASDHPDQMDLDAPHDITWYNDPIGTHSEELPPENNINNPSAWNLSKNDTQSDYDNSSFPFTAVQNISHWLAEAMLSGFPEEEGTSDSESESDSGSDADKRLADVNWFPFKKMEVILHTKFD